MNTADRMTMENDILNDANILLQKVSDYMATANAEMSVTDFRKVNRLQDLCLQVVKTGLELRARSLSKKFKDATKIKSKIDVSPKMVEVLEVEKSEKGRFFSSN